MSFHTRKYYQEHEEYLSTLSQLENYLDNTSSYTNIYNMSNVKFKKWATFLCNINNEKYTARQRHLETEKKKDNTWSHAKTNTMKLFFNDRDEGARDLEHCENVEKLKIFTNFIKQMSNKNRQFDISMKERV